MAGAKYTASDDLISWAQSVSGMLTTIRTKYGAGGQMLEDAQWDDGKTEYALALVQSLHRNVSKLHREMKSHVEEKFGQGPR